MRIPVNNLAFGTNLHIDLSEQHYAVKDDLSIRKQEVHPVSSRKKTKEQAKQDGHVVLWVLSPEELEGSKIIMCFTADGCPTRSRYTNSCCPPRLEATVLKRAGATQSKQHRTRIR